MPDDAPTPPARRSPLRWLPVIAVILLIPVLIFGSITYLFRHVVSPAADTPAARQLQHVGVALRTFAAAHGGGYPDDLATLVREGTLTADQLACPPDAGVPGGPFPYVYLGRGLSEQTVANGTVLAYDPIAAHAGRGSTLLFGDGSTTWVTADELPKELEHGRPPAGRGEPGS
jgi:hypothetical protein